MKLINLLGYHIKISIFQAKNGCLVPYFPEVSSFQAKFFLKGNMAFPWVCHMGVTLRMVA